MSGGGDGGDPLREGAVVARVGQRPRNRLGAGVPAALVGSQLEVAVDILFLLM